MGNIDRLDSGAADLEARLAEDSGGPVADDSNMMGQLAGLQLPRTVRFDK